MLLRFYHQALKLGQRGTPLHGHAKAGSGISFLKAEVRQSVLWERAKKAKWPPWELPVLLDVFTDEWKCLHLQKHGVPFLTLHSVWAKISPAAPCQHSTLHRTRDMNTAGIWSTVI